MESGSCCHLCTSVMLAMASSYLYLWTVQQDLNRRRIVWPTKNVVWRHHEAIRREPFQVQRLWSHTATTPSSVMHSVREWVFGQRLDRTPVHHVLHVPQWVSNRLLSRMHFLIWNIALVPLPLKMQGLVELLTWPNPLGCSALQWAGVDTVWHTHKYMNVIIQLPAMENVIFAGRFLSSCSRLIGMWYCQ